ncbi:AI-2E family transporter [Ancylobacter vacuolatus]|uniref:PurR-regulated permease PerM n=1 Tax=Ancylobacter vacuolatus TaxID=223389 RepID=A0ABU0DNV9_9HYPH|nr:AI-2E family transporter [Ancylobacter vacuolatus]MDQ0350114.1 putative PurR-regulated permease PerM [Ancylobacter vacuolatus]
MQTVEYKSFLLLIGLVSLAFAWVLWPLFGAVFWAAVIAIVFDPLNRRLLVRMKNRRNLAALATVFIILVIVIVPLLITAAALAQEASSLYSQVQSGELNLSRVFQPVFDALPHWASNKLGGFGLTNLSAAWEKVAAAMANGIQFMATEALSIGQSTFSFLVSLGVMLYLLFFLLRDGLTLADRVKDVIPLPGNQREALVRKFTVVIRATVKGDILVAALQGALGGLMFLFLGVHASLLWAVLMAFLSLLPVIGSALVWLPVAIYFIATGSIWQGIFLIAYGVLVIGLVDNFLRPLLVGQATKMPDYVVLISTIGGIETFGLHGFIIGPVIAAMFLAVWAIFSESTRTSPEDRTVRRALPPDGSA